MGKNFFSDLELSYANFKGRQKKTGLNSDTIDKIISKYPEISTDWLVLGKGEMLKSENSNTTETLEESEKKQYEAKINLLEKNLKDKDKIIILQEEQINMLKYLLEQTDVKAVKNVG